MQITRAPIPLPGTDTARRVTAASDRAAGAQAVRRDDPSSARAAERRVAVQAKQADPRNGVA